MRQDESLLKSNEDLNISCSPEPTLIWPFKVAVNFVKDFDEEKILN